LHPAPATKGNDGDSDSGDVTTTVIKHNGVVTLIAKRPPLVAQPLPALKKIKTKACAYCSYEFSYERASARYCSDACKVAANRLLDQAQAQISTGQRVAPKAAKTRRVT
jgi:hypothetical protein